MFKPFGEPKRSSHQTLISFFGAKRHGDIT